MPSKIKSSIGYGEKITFLRRSRRMSREALSEAADISVRQLADIEGEKCSPRLGSLVKIANALSVDLAELFT